MEQELPGRMVKAMMDFALDLMTRKESRSSNVLLSPFSMGMVSHMMYHGMPLEARKGLERNVELKEDHVDKMARAIGGIFHRLKNSGTKCTLEIENNIFIHNKVN